MDEIFTKAPLKKEEKLYASRQSTQIAGQTGQLGFLNICTTGICENVWTDIRAYLKTEKFKEEFDLLINDLRKEWQENKPDGDIRIDSAEYSYILKSAENRMLIFCYRKDWLDQQIRTAQKGIRFIDPNYKEKFRIPDGAYVKVTYSDGTEGLVCCRYVDEYHLEFGKNLYHICELAERLENCGAIVEPAEEE